VCGWSEGVPLRCNLGSRSTCRVVFCDVEFKVYAALGGVADAELDKVSL
jgi:hypothetical protein